MSEKMYMELVRRYARIGVTSAQAQVMLTVYMRAIQNADAVLPAAKAAA